MPRESDELTTNIYPHFLDVRFTHVSLWGNADYVLGTTLSSADRVSGRRILAPLALLDRARQFAAAADTLTSKGRADDSPHLFVIYFLYARAIELALKAFLSCHERSERELKSKAFGHDLGACLQEAERVGLARCFNLSEGHRIVIHWISHPYAGKDLEYTKVLPGGARLTEMPEVALVAAVARSFISGLETVCLQSTILLRPEFSAGG